MNDSYRPLNCILPEYVLETLIKNAKNERIRDWAIRSIASAARIRGQRDILSRTSAPIPAGEKLRKIYDAKGQFVLPGNLLRREGEEPTGDKAVDDVYDGLGATYDLFYEEYERNSLDDEGHPLEATVHYGVDFNNAFWNGRQMVFGDGDGEIFTTFTKSIDITAHELTHGVIEFSANLVYHHQPGALNEHFADVFGSLVKQRYNNQTAEEADWLIGEGLLGPDINGQALRSMKEPGTAYDDPLLGKDPQPGHMKNYDPSPRDNYGVHINSGIPNRAFYLLARSLGGYAWESAGQLWYDTLLSLNSHSEFQDAADTSYRLAGKQFGDGSEEQQAVRDAWSEVGVRVSGTRRRKRVRRRRETPDPADRLDRRLDDMLEKFAERLKMVEARLDGGAKK